MRILIDNLVAHSFSELVTMTQDDHPPVEVRAFDWSLDFPAIVGVFGDFRPDIIMLDPFAFTMAVHLLQVLNVHGFQDVTRVIGTSDVTNIVKVKARYKGFIDVVDLSSSRDDVMTHLREIYSHRPRLASDQIWRFVPGPNNKADIRLAPADPDDKNILELICIGLADRDIGATIHMSHQTVRNRISKMLSRSGATNRTQMAWLYAESKRVEALLLRANLHSAPHTVDDERPVNR